MALNLIPQFPNFHFFQSSDIYLDLTNAKMQVSKSAFSDLLHIQT